MNNCIKKILALSLAFICMFSFEIFAVKATAVTPPKNILQPNEMNTVNDTAPRVSGLIDMYYIGLSRSGNTMHLVAKVYCAADVVKCGFKEIVIYRRVSGTTSWSVVKTIKDVYDDSFSNLYTYELSILPNFDYRATCVHYAKKNILLTQTINDSSNII